MINIPGAVIIEGHIQGLSNTRSLGEMGIPVIVVDNMNCIARYSKYCSSFRSCPNFLTDDFAHFLIDLAKTEQLLNWVLFPSNDHAVHTISRFKSTLEQYYKIITPGIETIKRIYDKANLLNSSKDLNIPTPITVINTISKPLQLIPFPVIVKGRKGLSFYKTTGKKVFKAENQQELKALLNSIENKIDLNETLTQELIPTNKDTGTISFTSFSVNGEIKASWIGEKIREHPIQFGTATFCKSVSVPSLLEMSKSLIKELNYSGVCEIEYMKDKRDNKYKLIEINPRTWLWVNLAKACGVDYARMIYNHFHGNNSFPVHDNIKINIFWSNYFTDFVYSLNAIFSGKLTIKQYLKSYNGTVIRAVYSRSDFRPSIAYLFLLLKYLRNR